MPLILDTALLGLTAQQILGVLIIVVLVVLAVSLLRGHL
jgi:hypothetical protein